MQVLVCFVMASVFVSTIKSDRALNLPLGEFLKFDENNQPRDLAIIDQVQDVLTKIKNAMRRRSGRKRDTDISFTEFVLKAAKLLRDYNDNDLEEVYALIADESRRILKKSSLENVFGTNFRRYMTDKLYDLKDVPADSLRRHLDMAIDVIEKDAYPREIGEILDLGDSLYNGAGDTLNTALRSLEIARRSNGNIGEILRSTVKSLVNNHYSKLNVDINNDLLQIAKRFWDSFITKYYDKTSNQQSALMALRQRPIDKYDSQEIYTHKNNFQIPTLPTRSTLTTRTTSGRWHNNFKNRYIKLGPKYTTKSKNDPETFLSKFELNTSTNNTDSDEPRPRSNEKDSSSDLQEMPHLKHKSEKIGSQDKGHKILRLGIKKKDFSDSSDSQLLTGGQVVQDISLKDESSEDTTSKTEDSKGTKEYSDDLQTELSSENSGQNSESSTAAERSSTEDSSNKEEEDTSGSNQSTVFRASSEGMIIESFENYNNAQSKIIIRKSNVNDTLLSDLDPNAAENVKKLIENIEKAIKNVKDEIQYVKHLKQGDMNEQPKFKRTDSDENPSNKSSSSSPPNINPNSDSTDNELRFAKNAKKLTSGVAFRAHEDTDDNKSAMEIEYTRKSTQTIVADNTTETTITTNGITINKTVEEHAVKTLSVVNNNISDLSYKNKEKVNTDRDNEIDKPNDGNTVTDTSNVKKLNESTTTSEEINKNTVTHDEPQTEKVKLVTRNR